MYFSPSPMFWTAIVIFCFQFPSCTGQTTRDIGQLFGANRIVPDLLPSFDPTVLLQVTYNTTVVPGQILSQNGIDAFHKWLTFRYSNGNAAKFRCYRIFSGYWIPLFNGLYQFLWRWFFLRLTRTTSPFPTPTKPSHSFYILLLREWLYLGLQTQKDFVSS